MLDVVLYGAFALEAAQQHRISHEPLLEIARVPMAVNAGIIGAIIVPLVVQARVRDALTLLSLICLLVLMGLVFTSLLLLACVVVFAASRVLHRWSAARGDPTQPLLAGWLVVHAMYLPVFFTILVPFRGHMSWGEVSQVWGAAFVVLKSIHYIRICCDGRQDPFGPGAFRRFLLYMIHFASFRFGPYQTYHQFDSEVSTCKDRLTWRNRMIGLGRIMLGVAKFVIIFNWINRPFFYPHGYTGPLAEELFLNASEADPEHLWMMMYLYVIRLGLFISGLSDGVIGMNLMMGIRVPENARWPFFSRDVIDFWRRWHIQVGAFLRDEVFFPAGGARNRNLGYFCVFAYCGVWHYPTATGLLAFPALQVAAFAATQRWIDFWKRHELADDWIHRAGRRWWLHDSWLSHFLGMIFVFHVFALSCLFVFDHHYGGFTMLARMLTLTP